MWRSTCLALIGLAVARHTAVTSVSRTSPIKVNASSYCDLSNVNLEIQILMDIGEGWTDDISVTPDLFWRVRPQVKSIKPSAARSGRSGGGPYELCWRPLLYVPVKPPVGLRGSAAATADDRKAESQDLFQIGDYDSSGPHFEIPKAILHSVLEGTYYQFSPKQPNDNIVRMIFLTTSNLPSVGNENTDLDVYRKEYIFSCLNIMHNPSNEDVKSVLEKAGITLTVWTLHKDIEDEWRKIMPTWGQHAYNVRTPNKTTIPTAWVEIENTVKTALCGHKIGNGLNEEE